MEDALIYEFFLRYDFGIALTGKPFNNGEDPAEAANACYFQTEYLEEVKAAVGYAMMVIIKKLAMKKQLNNNYTDVIDNMVREVINASNLGVIASLITKFKLSISDI